MSYTLAYKGAEIDEILGRAATGGALDTAIAAKQDALTFDDTPESGSDNPVKSGGIYDAIQAGGAAALAAFATDSVSGDVVSFTDGADSIPVKAFAGSIIPAQSGSGDPAPDNIRPISGWTGANITRAGKNILDMTVGSWSSGIIAADGTITPNGAYHYMTDSRPIKGGTDYAFGVTKDTSSAVGFAVSFYDEDDNFISTNVVVPAATTTGRRTATFTTPSGTARYRLRCPVESPQITSYQIEEGSTATDYEAYQADTILLSFGQTVYAGTLTALGGGLWKIQPTHAYRSITSADVFAKSANAQIQTGRAGYYLTTSNQWLATVQKSGGDGNPNGVSILSDVVYIGDTSAYDVIPATTFEVGIGVASGNTNLWFNVDATTCPDVASFKTYLDSLSMHICYPLATLPDPITITGEDLQTLLGANTVWTDCGSVTGMTYRADTALYIDKKLGA